MPKMSFEEALAIHNKHYGEPKEIERLNPEHYLKNYKSKTKRIKDRAIVELITPPEIIKKHIKEIKKEFKIIDEITEKRKKKREKNRVKNEYERQFNVNRQIVLVLDNNECRECGSKEKLHVHHIKERCKGGTNDINNLITLCNNCHKEKHKNENVYNIMNA
jgi:predicted HNH restriction endonuclease